jgi:uncharacterized membrane protein
MWTAAGDLMQAKADTPNSRDLVIGVLIGLGGLASIALVLGVVDPLFRDPAGQVFSIAAILRALGILG